MGGVFSTYGREAHWVLVGIPEGKRPLGRTRLRWEGKMDLKGIVGVDWIDQAQDRTKWRAVVNTVMDLWFP
jgi:predicted membrane GTPase involved in stress response